MTRVRFTVEAGGSPVTNFSGVLSLATVAGQGLWFENVAAQPYAGSLTGGDAGDGTASYDFNGSEGGIVIFDFRNQVTASNFGFTATGVTDDGIALPQGGTVPEITDIAQCTLTITTTNATVNNLSDVCRANEEVVYTLTDRDGGQATGYEGTAILQTSTTAGNYVLTGGLGNLIGPGGNNGFATYEFDPDDNGIFTVDYSVLAAPAGLGDVTLTATISNVALDNTDGTLRYRDCVFNISFPSDTAPFETDVCSIKQVRIDLVDFDGDPVTDYTGTINLSTSTGFGSWAADVSANGSLLDPFGEDGSASYTFVDLVAGTDPGDDDGVVILNFTHTADDVAALNINVSDSITSDPGAPGTTDDPNLSIDLCTFQVSFDGGGLLSTHDDATMTACEVQQVTIEVFDSTGSLATDYTGQINITTTTNNGNWGKTLLAGNGNGALSNIVVDGGSVSYTFNDDGIGDDDDGVVILDFTNLNAETVNFDVVDEVIALGLDGVMVEEGAADPSLEIGSCIPTVAASVCATGGSGFGADLTIGDENSDPLQRSRMVLIATSHEGNATVTGVSFAGTAFTTPSDAQLLRAIQIDEGNFDSNTTLWAMKDVAMPDAGGDYPFTVTHGDNDVAACAFYVTDVEQVFPAEVANPNEADGQLNATGSAGADNPTSTTVTTTQNNALIMSIVSSGLSGTFSAVSPSPPITRLTQGPNPENGVFATSSGNASSAAAITINETASANPNRHSHIVAAFNPFISGPPVASGYEPVLLFQTYSGNVSYRAIGASFITSPNGGSVCTATNTATATLTLPDVANGAPTAGNGDPFSETDEFDSDVRAAYLYWFASGSHDLPNLDGIGGFANNLNPDDFDNVTLELPDGVGGSNIVPIIADDVFQIENVGGNNNADFYAGYADITALMPGTDNELVVGVMGHLDEIPNGDYTVTGVEIAGDAPDNDQPWYGRGSCAGGFAIVVVYENPYEQLRVINLFQGFQPFQNSSFTLVPRNFRIADRNVERNEPNGQITHITVEGDVGNAGADEELTLQETPGDFDPLDFNSLTTDFNPPEEEFNGTITRPVYALTDIVSAVDADPNDPTEYAYIFDNSSASDGSGNPANGYELDFPNPAVFPYSPVIPPVVPPSNGTTFALSYGVDIDTHFIDGDEVNDFLYEFADPLDLAEEITTRYSADQDLVMLVAEIISVTNDDIADIEVTITEGSADYKVNTNDRFYNIEVKNNGSGAAVFGTATGFIELVGELPTGMTFTGGTPITGAAPWDCTDFSASAFTCTYDIDDLNGLGDASLPTVSATVTIDGPPSNFSSLNNDAKVIVRVQHTDGSCAGGSTGILPTPSSSCEPPEFDNVNDLQGGALDINNIDDKTGSNNNVDSITTNVQGIETDLSVVKAVDTVLEEGSADSILYTITVTNNGPDDIVGGLAQPTISITDNEPVGINFDSASGTDWSCTVNVVLDPDQLTCDFNNFVSDDPLEVGESTVITIIGDVTGTSPTSVTNTVQVSSGLYNFDQVSGNNTAQAIANITAPPAVVTDKFLLSVSSLANLTDLGSGAGELADFTDDDIVLYDPGLDAATLFIDSATTPSYSVTDPNAIHLLPNGQVVMSANADSNTIGTNNQAFDKHDLVLYDKLQNTASLFFDGSVLVDVDEGVGDTITEVNIDSVYVLDDPVLGDGSFIFSTTGAASDGGVVSWSDSDLVLYNTTLMTFSIYLNAEDDEVFGSVVDAQVDALYLRVDPDNSTASSSAVLDSFVMSSEVQNALLGEDNVTLGQDDVAEITIDTGTLPDADTTTSTLLFNGNIPLGVFNSVEPNLKLNALHLIEPAYMGHFELSEVVQGNACTPATIRIRKHHTVGVNSHTTDISYTGAILISTDTVDGVWAIDTGAGVLDNSYGGDSDNGQALYTFVPGDSGEVTLTLNVVQDPEVIDSVVVSVTNGFVVDEDNDDNPFEFNLATTDVIYKDEFELAAYDNNDGTAGWSINWDEVDAFDGASAGSGAGLATGNIQMTGGKLSLSSNLNTNSGAIDPSMTRSVGLGLFTRSEPVSIKFAYGYQSVANGVDTIELQISSDDFADDGGLPNGNSAVVQSYSTLDTSSGSDVLEDITLDGLSAAIDAVLADIDALSPNLYVRWVITAGYVTGTFTVDDFEVSSGTTSCNTAGFNHYHIAIPATGLACVASTVQIEGHDFQHNPVSPGIGTVLQLSTSTGAGTWASVISGTGNLVDIGAGNNTDGQGTYTFTTDETTIELAFNYTDPVGDTSVVNINVTDGSITEIKKTLVPFDDSHDPDADFDEVGLLFYDQAAGSNFTSLPFQIAGKPSLTAPASGNVTLQIVRSVAQGGENAASVCESLVDDGDIVTIKIAGLCVDPMGCDVSSNTMTVVDAADVAQTTVPVFSSPTANPEASGLALTVEFSDLGSPIFGEENIGAPINFTYRNAGKISLHAEYDIPFNDDSTALGVASGDTINGASLPFIVRPFGFDIDFGSDRENLGGLSLATDANGPAFARAGVGFNATVSAVLWEQGDDVQLTDGTAGNDGIPDFEADLSDNIVATNFGDEIADNNTVEISVITTDPTNGGAANPGVPTGETGTMVTVDGSSDIFQAFSSGVSGPQQIAIDEVGIFDLAAELVDDNINRRAINYFDSDFTNYVAVEGVAGGARNVGRIYPNNFELVSSSFGPRSNQEMVCAMASPFTYMGEDFTVNVTLEAKNLQATTLQNYFGEFAKLNSFVELDMRAIIDVDVVADIDLDADMRLERSTFPDEFGSLTVSTMDDWSAGQILLSGDLRITRQASGVEEAPLENVRIAFSPRDNNINDGDADDLIDTNDVLLDVFNVDLDDGSPDVDPFDVDPVTGPFQFAEIAKHEFRYGRLTLENAFGSESEDLNIGIRIEYYDGDDFVINTADSCTAIVQTAGSEELAFVPGTYEDAGADFVPPLAPFADGVTVIEGTPLAPITDVTLTVFEGQSNPVADSDDDLTNDSERPFFTTAPDPASAGRVLIELDLDPGDDDSPSSLHFLEYDWRGGLGEGVGDYAGDLFDEEPDGTNYNDNPRAIIEFGSFRGHDRVINWQEIYIGPTSQ